MVQDRGHQLFRVLDRVALHPRPGEERKAAGPAEAIGRARRRRECQFESEVRAGIRFLRLGRPDARDEVVARERRVSDAAGRDVVVVGRVALASCGAGEAVDVLQDVARRCRGREGRRPPLIDERDEGGPARRADARAAYLVPAALALVMCAVVDGDARVRVGIPGDVRDAAMRSDDGRLAGV
jgi:hypothetical protein